MDTTAAAKKSDLGVRTLSAIVMVVVAGTALWLGGWVWTAFVVLVAMGVLWEWASLAFGVANSLSARLGWLLGGLAYIAPACFMLVYLRLDASMGPEGVERVLIVILPVVATDIGAYLAGRTIGGPKIAPAISPSKTWSGGAGGVVSAMLVISVMDMIAGGKIENTIAFAILGALASIVAQAGDFFQSWMKRRAGVKDSGNLIPGHGGLFDRVDGLLAVCFVLGVIFMVSRLWGGL